MKTITFADRAEQGSGLADAGGSFYKRVLAAVQGLDDPVHDLLLGAVRGGMRKMDGDAAADKVEHTGIVSEIACGV